METYIFIVLLFISFAFVIKVFYSEKENFLPEKDNSKKPLHITVPTDPKYNER